MNEELEQPIDSITQTIALVGLALTVIASGMGGLSLGTGAAVGAVVAVAHWTFTRWLGKRIFQAKGARRAGLSLLLATKMALVVGCCWALMARLEIDAVGFAMGWSALVVGAGMGSLFGAEVDLGLTEEPSDV